MGIEINKDDREKTRAKGGLYRASDKPIKRITY